MKRILMTAGLALAGWTALAAAAPRPNIILVMADDQGWTDVGYNSAGNPERAKVRTPNLDAMAAHGLRFDRFYAQSPNCSPTRGSVMTGRHPYRYGVFNPGFPFRPAERTIAQVLGGAGYRTGHFGKWHLNGIHGPGRPVQPDDPLGPGKLGFDTWFSVSNFFETDWTFGTPAGPVKTEGDGSDAIMAEAVKFIRGAAGKQEPFFAVIWFGSPHVPLQALPAYKEKAGGSDYYGEIYGIDHAVGTLRAELRALGLAENTLVWYCSDNGGVPPCATAGLRGHKGQLWEGGLRVPGIIEWPARIAAARRTAVPAVTSDIFPTLLDVAGVAAPVPARPLDGISLAPLIDGKMAERPQPIAFQHGTRPGQESGPKRGHAALTDHRYKLHQLAGSSYELYDVLEDPAEGHDLAAQQPEVVAAMKAKLLAWEESVRRSLAGEDYK